MLFVRSSRSVELPGRPVSSELVGRLIRGLYPDFFTKREKAMQIYSLFDRKVREFGPLVTTNNDESALRAIRDGVPGSGGTIAKYPEDFDLMLLGAFDADTGQIVPESVPLLVANVGDVLKAPSPRAGAPDA